MKTLIIAGLIILLITSSVFAGTLGKAAKFPDGYAVPVALSSGIAVPNTAKNKDVNDRLTVLIGQSKNITVTLGVHAPGSCSFSFGSAGNNGPTKTGLILADASFLSVTGKGYVIISVTLTSPDHDGQATALFTQPVSDRRPFLDNNGFVGSIHGAYNLMNDGDAYVSASDWRGQFHMESGSTNYQLTQVSEVYAAVGAYTTKDQSVAGTISISSQQTKSALLCYTNNGILPSNIWQIKSCSGSVSTSAGTNFLLADSSADDIARANITSIGNHRLDSKSVFVSSRDVMGTSDSQSDPGEDIKTLISGERTIMVEFVATSSASASLNGAHGNNLGGAEAYAIGNPSMSVAVYSMPMLP